MRMAFAGILSFIPIILIVLIVLIVSGAKSETKKGKGGEEVIKSVYIYLVLFATLMMTIGGSVGAFMAIADIVSPTPYYQTFEEYKMRDMVKPGVDENNEVKEELSEEELRQRYDAMVAEYKQNAVDRAKILSLRALAG